jgi:hypothetical protein
VEHGVAKPGDRRPVADASVEDDAGDPSFERSACQQIAAMGHLSLPVDGDDEHVTGLCPTDRLVKHQVVTTAATCRERGTRRERLSVCSADERTQILPTN